MDIDLNYEEKGKGKVLILLHGNGEDHTYFSAQMDFFSAYYRTIAIDTRWHGLSERGEGEFSLHRFSDDLYSFMKEKAIDKAYILGFSDGGNIALLFALSHMDMVEKLILNGANLNPAGLKKSVMKEIEKEYRTALMNDDARTSLLMSLMINEPDIRREELSALSIPVLVIAGTDDMILRKHTRLIASSITDSRLSFLEGDHFIAEKKSEEFNKVVLDFLLE